MGELFFGLLSFFFLGFQVLVVLKFHIRIVLGVELVLEMVMLLHYIIDHRSDHKAGEVDKTFEFVGHHNRIWTTKVVKLNPNIKPML